MLQRRKVFDWNKAAQIINERGLTEASAGLCGDYGNTEGVILHERKPYMDDYTYLASTWAVPMLLIYSDKEPVVEEEIPCFIYSDETEWDAHTKWPKTALDLLL